MGHETSYGSPWNRAKAYGYGSAAAENVAMNIIAPNAEQQKKCRDPVGNYFPKIRDTVESAKYASCQLYNSEGHRVNMLKPDVNQIGYGFATNGRDSYHTEMYGRSDQPCVSNYGNPGYPSNPQPKAPEQQPKRPEQPKTPQQPRAPYKQPEVPRKETPAQPPKQEYTPTPPPPTPTRPPRQAYTPVRQPYTPPKQEYKPDSPQRPSTPYTPETPKESPKVPTYSYGTPDVPAKKKKRVCVRSRGNHSS
ncbi:hypothetical protein BKA69DRAFT_344954 [Paraphysoderma sedebokerense]|nr:hypothetical protein BKA69DRAFT_344954 [Paraphysoderma sedebokerense]